jgi:putative uncharacterized protein FNV2250
MSESIKINMPFEKWCKIQKDFEELNSKLPEDKKLDFEKYKYCYNWGKLSFDLYCVGVGMKETLREPEFYNKKEF